MCILDVFETSTKNVLIFKDWKDRPFCLNGIYTQKIAIFLLLFDHINKDIIFVVMLSYGKLDLGYFSFFLAGPKTVWICCTYQWPKSPRKIICHEFWRNMFVYLQTHLLMQAIASANKQLLSVVM